MKTGVERQIGVEEEFLLVDKDTSQPMAGIGPILGDAEALVGDQVQAELHQSQIEIATPPCDTLSEVREHLDLLRRHMADAAAAHGALVVANGTYPGEMGEAGRRLTPKPRYLWLGRESALVAREQLICGCHVHVTVDDPDRAVAIMNLARRWMPCIIALAANSPYWEGQDTGFASFRTEVWARWPTAGPTGSFGSHDEYVALLDRVVATGVILDRGMAYWDIRPSERFPTLEFRVADVMTDIEDALLVAGLLRGLVERLDDLVSTDEGAELRPELLRAASWRAARTGLAGVLVDPADGSAVPATAMLERLVDFVGPGLERHGDGPAVEAMLASLREKGTGAERQRLAFDRRRSMADVIASTVVGREAGGSGNDVHTS